VSRHTGKSIEQLEKDSDRDYYMSAHEAKAYGIVDHVVENAADTAAITPPTAAAA
jgi:ATP-dependent Clp protease protease subunit